jgi:hypothetical protein
MSATIDGASVALLAGSSLFCLAMFYCGCKLYQNELLERSQILGDNVREDQLYYKTFYNT